MFSDGVPPSTSQPKLTVVAPVVPVRVISASYVVVDAPSFETAPPVEPLSSYETDAEPPSAT